VKRNDHLGKQFVSIRRKNENKSYEIFLSFFVAVDEMFTDFSPWKLDDAWLSEGV
jgi:hypothetical protein